jgi:hypothetical protein
VDSTIWDAIIARQHGAIEFARQNKMPWLEVLARDTMRVAEERKAGNHAARTIPLSTLLKTAGIKARWL